MGEVLNPCRMELMDTTQISTETCDTFDQESEHVNRLPNIVQTSASPPYHSGLFASGINDSPSAHEGLALSTIRGQEASTAIVECDKSAFVRMQRIPQPPSIPMIHSSALAVSAIQYGNCLSQNLGTNCVNSFSTASNCLLPNASVAYPLIHRVESPLKSVVNGPVEERPQTVACIPKLPLQFTKSMEEMLKPPGQTEDTMNWNRPLGSDWANDVKTPNKELVAQLFPDCADSI